MQGFGSFRPVIRKIIEQFPRHITNSCHVTSINTFHERWQAFLLWPLVASFLKKIQVFRCESSGAVLYIQDIKSKVSCRSTRDVRSIANARFSSTIFFIFSMLSSLTVVDRRLELSKVLTTLRHLLNILSLKYFRSRSRYSCDILNDSVIDKKITDLVYERDLNEPVRGSYGYINCKSEINSIS